MADRIRIIANSLLDSRVQRASSPPITARFPAFIGDENARALPPDEQAHEVSHWIF
jgi:hypothetical protein